MRKGEILPTQDCEVGCDPVYRRAHHLYRPAFCRTSIIVHLPFRDTGFSLLKTTHLRAYTCGLFRCSQVYTSVIHPQVHFNMRAENSVQFLTASLKRKWTEILSIKMY